MARPGSKTLERQLFEAFDTLTTHEGRCIYAEAFIRKQIIVAGYKPCQVSRREVDRACGMLIERWYEARR